MKNSACAPSPSHRMAVRFVAALIGAGGVVAQVSAAAGAPAQVVEQGRLIDRTTNQPLTGSVSMVFSIYAADRGGAALWQETLVVALEDGHFSVPLGKSVPFPAGLWADSPRFLGVRVGTDSEMLPREEILSVPYSLTAEDAVGDIRPRSISVAGKKIVDDKGTWVGPPMAGGSQIWSATHAEEIRVTNPVDVTNVEPLDDFHYPKLPGIAKFSFRSEKAGFALLTTNLMLGVRNYFDKANPWDCHVATGVGPTAVAPKAGRSEPGVAFTILTGKTPTQQAAGGYQTFTHTLTRLVPVTAGMNTYHLSLQSSCLQVIVAPFTMYATFVGEAGAAEISR
jgi:hypothetical protein